MGELHSSQRREGKTKAIGVLRGLGRRTEVIRCKRSRVGRGMTKSQVGPLLRSMSVEARAKPLERSIRLHSGLLCSAGVIASQTCFTAAVCLLFSSCLAHLALSPASTTGHRRRTLWAQHPVPCTTERRSNLSCQEPGFKCPDHDWCRQWSADNKANAGTVAFKLCNPYSTRRRRAPSSTVLCAAVASAQ